MPQPITFLKWMIPSQYTAFIYSKSVNACQDVELVAETAKAILGLASLITNALPLKSDHCWKSLIFRLSSSSDNITAPKWEALLCEQGYTDQYPFS